MKKSVLTLIAVLGCVPAFASTLPDGKFSGDALYSSAKGQGTYSVNTTITGNTIATEYVLKDGSKKEWKFDMEPTSGGFFKVKAYDLEIGQGYCLQKASVCHYEIKVAKLSLEETITAMNGKLYKFGSKDEGKGRILWQEALDPK
jgi:hypothetical protein